jgi:hypothetical protein
MGTQNYTIGHFIRVFQDFVEFAREGAPIDDEDSRELARLWRPLSLAFARFAIGSSVLEGQVLTSEVAASQHSDPLPLLAGVDDHFFSLVDARAGELLGELRHNGSWPAGLSAPMVLSAGLKLISAVNANNRNRRGSYRPGHPSSWA